MINHNGAAGTGADTSAHITQAGIARLLERGWVEDFRIETFRDFARLRIVFKDIFSGSFNPALAEPRITMDLSPDRIVTTWKCADGRQWRHSLDVGERKTDTPDRMMKALNDMVDYVLAVQSNRADFGVYRSDAAMLASVDNGVVLPGSSLVRLARNGDVQSFVLSRFSDRTRLAIRLSSKTLLPVESDAGSAMVTLEFNPDWMTMAWPANGGDLQKTWRGDIEAVRKAVSDPTDHFYRELAGEPERDLKGKAFNPMWALVKRLGVFEKA
jgi:hypothetical protein